MVIRNRELFYEIAKQIEDDPGSYDQRTWGEFVPTKVDLSYIEEMYEGEDRLLEEARRLVEEHPDADSSYKFWGSVGCGTAMCIAGHAAALRGWYPTVVGGKGWGLPYLDWARLSRKRGEDQIRLGPDAHQSVEAVAKELLGLDDCEAGIVFDGDNKWAPDDLREFGDGVEILPKGDN